MTVYNLRTKMVRARDIFFKTTLACLFCLVLLVQTGGVDIHPRSSVKIKGTKKTLEQKATAVSIKKYIAQNQK